MIHLEPYRPDFFEPFCTWRNQSSTKRYNPLRPFTREYLADMLAGESTDLSDLSAFSTFRWFVMVDSSVVGSVCLKDINSQMGTAEIGYGLDEAWHGRGVGTAAVRQMVQKVLSDTSLRKIIAMVHTGNVGSCRLLERLGFQREGILREHYVIEGSPVDEAVYGLLRRDWQEVSP